MIKIWIGDELLDMPAKTSIKLERNSNLFENEQIRGDYTYPFTIPLTEHNRKLLGNIQDNTFAQTDITYRIKAQFTGLIRYGLMYVDSVEWNINTQTGYISVTTVLEEGLFYSLIKGKMMKDFTYGGVIPVPAYTNPNPTNPWSNVIAWANDIANGVVTDQPFVFPMVKWENFAPEGKRDKDLLAQKCINHWWPANGGTSPAEYPVWIYSDRNSNSSMTAYYNRMVPMFYLQWVMEQLFTELGYELECELFTDTDFQKLILLSNYSVNLFTDSAVNSDDLCTFIDPRNHMPDMTVVQFLNEIVKPFGAVYYFTADNKVSIKLKKTIAQQQPVHIKHDLNPQITKSYTDIPEIAKGINFSYGVTDKDNAFSTLGNSGLDTYNIKGAVDTYTDLAALTPDENDIQLVTDENKYYQFNGFEWVIVSNNLIDYLSNDNAFAMSCAAVPVPDQETEVYNNWDGSGILFATFWYQLPQMDMAGTYFGDNQAFVGAVSDGNKLRKGDPMGIHLMFYHGLQTKESPNPLYGEITYPYGSSYHYAPDDARTKIGNWHLGWGEAEGLVEVFYALWLSVMANTRKIAIDIYLNEAELDSILLEQPYFIYWQNYFIYKMSYAAPHKTLAQFEIYKT